MSRVTILGATGPTGRHVLDRALDAGHQVTVLVRDPARLQRSDAKVTIVTGDATKVDDLRRALVDSEAFLTALGSGNDRKSHVASQAARALLEATADRPGLRAVVMSAFGVGESLQQGGRLQRVMIAAVMKEVFTDKAAADDLLRASDLDWTLVYPVTLSNKPATGKIKAAEQLPVTLGSRITRADVATFMVDQIGDSTWSGRTVLLANA